jgi:hypothetical protein
LSAIEINAKDNRLLPAGFDKADASDDIAVYGKVADDEDFVGGADQVIYEMNGADAQGKLDITVELFYQNLLYSFLTDLASIDTDLVNRFLGLYESAGNTPEVLGMVQVATKKYLNLA